MENQSDFLHHVVYVDRALMHSWLCSLMGIIRFFIVTPPPCSCIHFCWQVSILSLILSLINAFIFFSVEPESPSFPWLPHHYKSASQRPSPPFLVAPLARRCCVRPRWLALFMAAQLSFCPSNFLPISLPSCPTTALTVPSSEVNVISVVGKWTHTVRYIREDVRVTQLLSCW